MKGNTVAILFLAAVFSLVPYAASAQLPPSLEMEFDFEGMGNSIVNSPVIYSGDIYDGDQLVVGGTWWIRLDDSTWPPVSAPQARWDYIFNTYFHYDPGTFSWTAIFDEMTLPTKPTWQITHPVNGIMGGTLVVAVQYTDWDMDGVLDIGERTFAMYSGTLIVMKYGTGMFAGYCGEGSYNGALNNGDPANWANDSVEGHCTLLLEDCAVGTRAITWSGVKELFR
jgi:hypothetical protein